MTGQEVARPTPMQEAIAHVASDNFLAKLENALPEDVTSKRFASVAVTAIKQNPDLVVADRESLYNSIVKCAQDGLMPDGRDAALVVFNTKQGKKVQYLPMIGGLRKIAGEFGYSINAQVVYENDAFDYELGERPKLMHKPPTLGTDRGQMIGAYAMARDAVGRLHGPEVMSSDEIAQVRAVSRAKDGDLWTQWTAEAWRKTVARRLFKQLPRVIAVSDDGEQRVSRVMHAMDDEFEFPDRPRMTEQEANIAATITQLPAAPDEDVALREDPGERAADHILNRIAHLTEQLGEGGARMAQSTLAGVFGKDSAEDLSPDDAERFARMLEDAAADEVVEGEVVDEAEAAGTDGNQAEAASAESAYARAARLAGGVSDREALENADQHEIQMKLK
jgi:recombination protein RecT